MRQFTEPTCKHLLRQPLIFGVPASGVLLLSGITVGLQALAYGDRNRSAAGLAISVTYYCTLRLYTKYAKPGWDQVILFALERLTSKQNGSPGELQILPSRFEILPPDTMDDEALLHSKQLIEDELRHLRLDQTLILSCSVGDGGAELAEVVPVTRTEKLRKKKDLDQALITCTGGSEPYVYSLYDLPVTTDPLWIFSHTKDITQHHRIILSVRGIDQTIIKRRIESHRRLNSQLNSKDEVDSDISFEDASQVLKGLSRGDDHIVELSLVIISQEELPLDRHFFCKETNLSLAVLSVFGLRPRFHRSHLVRIATATDMVPLLGDPVEEGAAIMQTVRGRPLYFDPQDPRLDALHWLVAGATGTGKSFFVGCVLWRLIQSGRPISVLFIDHKRSFKRLVKLNQGHYLEPNSYEQLESKTWGVLKELESPGILTGIELSDLPLADKQKAASYVLRSIAEFLNKRKSGHVLYVVMDECWKFLKHDPMGVQEAFREFRKFDAAAVAITQSIRDFISEEAGQAIVQNADITILLRQKEDVTQYRNILDLNDPEISKVKQIKKKKGIYSECLIKTPFLSRFGRLYPTQEEHEILRTDNLRAERVTQEKPCES